jgi:hypothetical protein
MSSEVGTNDPSQLTIINPRECNKARQTFLTKRLEDLHLDDKWGVGKSTRTDECYYFNKLTGESQWNFPTIAVSQAAPANNSLTIGSNSSSNLTGGSRKYKKQRKQRKKSKTIKRRK